MDHAYICGEEKELYLANFSAALTGFQKAIPNIGYINERDQVLPYSEHLNNLVDGIKNALHLFSYKREDSDKRGIKEFFIQDRMVEGENNCIAIDPTNSGYPNSFTLETVYNFKKEAEAILSRSQPFETILGAYIYGLFERKEIPRDVQENIVRYNTLKDFQERNLPKKSHGERVEFNRIDGGYEIHSIFQHFSLIDNMFKFFSATYEVSDKLWTEIANKQPHPEINRFLNFAMEKDPYMGFLELDNFRTKLWPTKVDKMTIGPFLCPLTTNNDNLNEIFNKIKNPYALDIKIQEVNIQEKTKHSSIADKNGIMHQYIICPFDIKKSIEEEFKLNKSTDRYKSGIFGITDKGDLVD